ncbi:MAG: aminotransferase class V-fold PLP-dependent enzyme [Solirubrobacteraceae bacterium]|nr:aminotransferase class V-fold PLP-dependent enzyme [Solirubrobacteraceae bacterium]
MSDDTTSGPVWGDESGAVLAAVVWASSRVIRQGDPKGGARTADELAAAAGETVTPGGLGPTAAMRIFDEVIVPATRAQDDPMNLAYIPAAPTRAAVAFDLATSAANIFAGVWEAGAGAIFAENEALAWIVSLLGWPDDAGGCFVSGGTTGNLSALMAAREAATAHRGGRPAGGWTLACSAEAHSSVQSAARVLDVDLLLVPVDERGHLTGAALREALAGAPDVSAVVASAGTTNAGIVDDLDDLATVCEEHGVWLHVDGAYGGAGLAAASVRDRFIGVERADSFIVDPHKWLFAPYDCCALLYRDPDRARAAHTQMAGYLDQLDRQAWNPTDLAIHLSRRARGLPFWFSLATHGTDRYAEAVERTIRTARTVAEAIDAAPHLELIAEPELSIVLFRRPGWSDDDYTAWSEQAAHDGVMLCVPTKFQGETALRLAFINPETNARAVIDVLETLR